MKIRFRPILAGAFVLALAARAPAAPEEGNGARARLERLKKVYTLARAATRDIPRDTFDPDAVLARTGKRPRDVLAWVRDHTEWVPYRGALRGWRGVLMDRVGSHLDRALLLAELLRRAGETVRIERGRIPAEEVDAIRARLGDRPPVSAPEPPGEEALDSRLAEIARILGVPLARVRRDHEAARLAAERRREDIALRTSLLADVLGRAAGIDPGAAAKPAGSEGERELFRDFFRVAVARGSNWLPIDPLVEGGAPGDSVFEEPAETFAPDAIPPACRHRVRFRVLAERLAGGGLSRGVVLDREVDAAALFGKNVILRMKALDWPLDLPKVTLDREKMRELSERTEKALAEQKEWLPILDLDGEVVRQKSFRDDGTVVDEPAITLQSRKVSRANEALSGLGGGGGRDGELSGVFVEIVFTAPGREPVREERAWVDLVGPARRAAGAGGFAVTPEQAKARAVALGGMTSYLALPCRPSRAWLAHRRLAALLENRVPILGAMYAAGRDEGDRVSRYLDRARPAPMELYALAGSRFAGPESGEIYVDGLNLLSSFTLPERTADGVRLRQGLDLIRTRVAPRPGSAVAAVAARFVQGVRDTVAESRTLPPRVGTRVNAADRLAKDVAAGREWVVLREAADADATALDADSRALARAALAKGLLVVAPSGPPGDGETAAWFEIDPATGATIGRIAGGRGGMTEETILMINDCYSLIRTMKGVLDCRGKDDLAMACCLLQNAAFGGYGLALGGALSGAVSDLWGVAVNVAYTETTSQIDLCGS